MITRLWLAIGLLWAVVAGSLYFAGSEGITAVQLHKDGLTLAVWMLAPLIVGAILKLAGRYVVYGSIASRRW
ncbi:MAG: hypothetical protein ACR2JB_29585 [Bryobacteraceae bacterium]